MNALETLITMAQEFDDEIDPETSKLGDEAAADLAALRTRAETAEQEREELFKVAVLTFDAMSEIGVGLAPEELTPRIRALDHALANDLSDELWERINAAALAKGGEA